MSPREQVEQIAEALLECLAKAGVDDMRETAKGYRGSCPHCGKPDRFELRERENHDGVSIYCHAGCPEREIRDVLELSWKDLRVDAGPKMRNDELASPKLENARPIEWAWQDRIPTGRWALLVGNEGTGKGTVTAHLAARWTKGELPGDLFGKPATVLVIGDEDLLNDVWAPRLHLAEADFAKVKFQAVGDFDIDLTNLGDVEHLRKWVRSYEIRVVVFDALLDHLGNVDEFKPRAVREALKPLRRMAGDEKVAALGSMHPRKGKVSSFRELVSCSHQLNAVSRSSLLLARHPDDEMRRVIAFGKGNHAGNVPSMEFRVDVVHFELNGFQFRDVRAADWKESDVDLDAAVRSSTGEGKREPLKLEQAKDVICELLQGGSRLSAKVKRETIDRVECGHATVERAAAELHEDGVISSEGTGKATLWSLVEREEVDEEEDPGKTTPLYIGGSENSSQLPPPHDFVVDEEVVANGHGAQEAARCAAAGPARRLIWPGAPVAERDR